MAQERPAPSRRVRQGGFVSLLLGSQNGDLEMVEVIWSFFEGKRRIRREVGEPLAGSSSP